MPRSRTYSVCHDQKIRYVKCFAWKNRFFRSFPGITQEDIDEKRRVPEREMLESMENLIKQGGDLNKLDSQGAAPVHFISRFLSWEMGVM